MQPKMLEWNPNIISAFLGAATSIICTFGIIKFSKHESASEREIEARADFVELLQKRVGELENRIDTILRREVTSINKLRQEQNDLDRRYRHLVSGLITYSNVLTHKLNQLGAIDLPLFTGWEKFLAEGGDIRPEWKGEQC